MSTLCLSILRRRVSGGCLKSWVGGGGCGSISFSTTSQKYSSIFENRTVHKHNNNIPCLTYTSKTATPSGKGGTPPEVPKQGPLASFMNLPNDSTKITHAIFGPDSDWVRIYRFGHIVTARVVQRAKIFQTAFSCFILLPVTFFSMAQGVVGPGVFSIVAGGSGLACVMLFIMGNLFSNVVGIIYVTDRDPEIVRIAHLTFWGTREDEIYKKTDFVPLGDLPDSVHDAYVKLRLYSDPEHVLKISLKYGTIYDGERFFDVFGNCEDLVVTKKAVTKEGEDKPS